MQKHGQVSEAWPLPAMAIALASGDWRGRQGIARPAARPHGGHPARGLHRGGEAPDRQALPRAAPDRAQRPQEVADRLHRHGPARDHLRLHARGRRAQPRARDRLGLPQGRAPGRRGQPKRKVSVSEPRVRELLGRRRFYTEAKRRTREPGVATGLAWTPVGGDVLFVEATAMPGNGHADRHRPARRRHARVGAGRAVLRARARARPRARARRATSSPPTTSTCTCPSGATPKDGPSAGITMATALMSLVTGRAGARRHRDDRRDHADRPGAADRRAEGEVAGRAARRDQADHRAEAQRGRPRGHPRAAAQGPRVPLGGGGRRGLRGGAGAARGTGGGFQGARRGYARQESENMTPSER